MTGKPLWDNYLAEHAWNSGYHFKMDGVETLHFWWEATATADRRNRAIVACTARREVPKWSAGFGLPRG
jgi:hypothetical protein